nr:protoporphyrinogen oxidase, chloroplastic isoform X2 [Ipomoea trifida]
MPWCTMTLAPLNHSAVATSIFPHLCPPSSFSLPSINLKRRNSTGWRVRCSVATDSPSKVNDSGNPFPTFDCVVVGAGISGLCTAQALSTSYPNLLVTEARDRVGGNITTVERDGYLWEEGPNSFQPSEPVLRMVVDCGLKDDLVLGDPNAAFRLLEWKAQAGTFQARGPAFL